MNDRARAIPGLDAGLVGAAGAVAREAEIGDTAAIGFVASRDRVCPLLPASGQRLVADVKLQFDLVLADRIVLQNLERLLGIAMGQRDLFRPLPFIGRARADALFLAERRLDISFGARPCAFKRHFQYVARAREAGRPQRVLRAGLRVRQHDFGAAFAVRHGCLAPHPAENAVVIGDFPFTGEFDRRRIVAAESAHRQHGRAGQRRRAACSGRGHARGCGEAGKRNVEAEEFHRPPPWIRP